MTKKILILDSNKKTVASLCDIIKKIHPNITIYTPDDFDEACKIALSIQIDVFLLDIIITNEIPGDTSGLKFATCIRRIHHYLFTPIIFVTGIIDQKFYTYDKLHCFAYLEKPFCKAKAEEVLRKALLYEAPREKEKTLYFRKTGVLYAVEVKDILYITAIQHVLVIHMKTEVLEIPYLTIKQFLIDADDTCFLQCSRNTVVNTCYIQYVDIPNRYIKLKQIDTVIDIGAAFIKKVTEHLNDR